MAGAAVIIRSIVTCHPPLQVARCDTNQTENVAVALRKQWRWRNRQLFLFSDTGDTMAFDQSQNLMSTARTDLALCRRRRRLRARDGGEADVTHAALQHRRVERERRAAGALGRRQDDRRMERRWWSLRSRGTQSLRQRGGRATSHFTSVSASRKSRSERYRRAAQAG